MKKWIVVKCGDEYSYYSDMCLVPETFKTYEEALEDMGKWKEFKDGMNLHEKKDWVEVQS